jgi:putative transposase
LSRRHAASHYGVGISTVIKWGVALARDGQRQFPGKMGGHRLRKLSGQWRTWLLDRCRRGEFTRAVWWANWLRWA